MAATTRTRAAKKTAPAKKAARKVAPAAEEDSLELPDEALAATGEPLEVYYDLEKETPGTFRFKEDYDGAGGQLPVTGVIYIKKTGARQLGDPTRIKVTIEAVDDL